MARGGKRPNAGRKRKSDSGRHAPRGLKSGGQRAVQADPEASPLTGVVPPKAHRWKRGQSGNPGGSRSAGAHVKEWINALCDATEDEVRQIAHDRKASWAKRTAALRILEGLEAGNMADFEPVLLGKKTLRELEAEGLNTEVVKRFKRRSRVIPGKDGAPDVVELVVEIELHDRAGAAFDRIMDRTDGRPTQALKVDATVGPRTVDEGAQAAAVLLVLLQQKLGVVPGAAPLLTPAPESASGESK